MMFYGLGRHGTTRFNKASPNSHDNNGLRAIQYKNSVTQSCPVQWKEMLFWYDLFSERRK